MYSGLRMKPYQFNPTGVSALTKLSPNESRKLHDQYCSRRTSLGKALDLEASIGTLALADCRKAGIAPDAVVQHIAPVVREALINLASEPPRWRVPGGLDEHTKFSDWMTQPEGPGFRRRVQELLGIQERPANRFLVLQNGKPPCVTDEIMEVFDRADAPVVFVVSAASLANQIRAHIPDPLFILES